MRVLDSKHLLAGLGVVLGDLAVLVAGEDVVGERSPDGNSGLRAGKNNLADGVGRRCGGVLAVDLECPDVSCRPCLKSSPDDGWLALSLLGDAQRHLVVLAVESATLFESLELQHTSKPHASQPSRTPKS